ncbi:MAG: hypothetical protein J0J06_01565 [Sphingomonas sp.]|uniref:hypothetical protein n=1 Tax=Sphingomonas sp. TaxID=28214 RepID=UPI001AC307B1|nr:hypothetical protein [Sphingomonas sp.]MBN8814118.1 hypothetical protein [Sphingomonas sp.]
MSNEVEIATRYVHAVTHMLLRRRTMQPGVAIVAGEPLDAAKRVGLGQMARQADTDIVHLAFDHTDRGYEMVGLTVAAPRNIAVYSYPNCRLSLIGRRTVIMPPEHVRGHFVLEPHELIHKPAKPDGWDEGIRRAERQLVNLIAHGIVAHGQIALHTLANG